MQKSKNLAADVTSVIYVPTLGASSLMGVGYVMTGLAIYAVSMFGAYKAGLFQDVRRWSVVSIVPVAVGPLLLCVAFYFSTQRPTYALMIPVTIYAVLGLAGWIAFIGNSTLPPGSSD